MRKSLLCSLVAVSTLIAGSAFAGSYGSAESYASADNSSIASGWYVGLGVNRGATDTVDVTTKDSVGITTNNLSVDTSDYGWSLMAGKRVTDMLSVELQYAQYGDETATNTVGDVKGSYTDMYSIGVVGVLKTPSWNGVSALAKGGVAYFNEDASLTDVTNASESSTYSGSNFTYGFGAQYDYNQFGVRFDWSRIDVNSNETGDFLFAPDQYTLSFLYNFA